MQLATATFGTFSYICIIPGNMLNFIVINFNNICSILNSGDKLAKLLAAFPIMNLSAGTCVALIVIGGSTSKMFYQTLCGCQDQPVTMVEWYLVFTCGAVVLSQLPNLNSIAGVSFIGAITAVGYCTGIWVVSVTKGRLPNVSYNPVRNSAEVARVFDVLNALGIIVFAFRGHNLILEIQVFLHFTP